MKKKEPSLHCGWECKLLKPLWRTVWRFLKKLKIELTYNPVTPLLDINLKKTLIWKDTFNPTITAALFTRAKTPSQVALMVKNPPANSGDLRDAGSIPGSGRCPGGGNGHPLQYSCPENPMDRWAWRATVHVVAKSRTPTEWLSTKRSNLNVRQQMNG